jgi:hypothetical protein
VVHLTSEFCFKDYDAYCYGERQFEIGWNRVPKKIAREFRRALNTVAQDLLNDFAKLDPKRIGKAFRYRVSLARFCLQMWLAKFDETWITANLV